jgi:hypothetical protein
MALLSVELCGSTPLTIKENTLENLKKNETL